MIIPPSMQHAKCWYGSSDYQSLAQYRAAGGLPEGQTA